MFGPGAIGPPHALPCCEKARSCHSCHGSSLHAGTCTTVVPHSVCGGAGGKGSRCNWLVPCLGLTCGSFPPSIHSPRFLRCPASWRCMPRCRPMPWWSVAPHRVRVLVAPRRSTTFVGLGRTDLSDKLNDYLRQLHRLQDKNEEIERNIRMKIFDFGSERRDEKKLHFLASEISRTTVENAKLCRKMENAKREVNVNQKRFHVVQRRRQCIEEELNKVKSRAKALDYEKKELRRHMSEVELQVEKLRTEHDYTVCHESAEGWGEVISECSSGTDVDELAEDVVTSVSKLLTEERQAAEKVLRSLVCKMLQKVEEVKEKTAKDQREAVGFRQEASQLRVEDIALHKRLDELQTAVPRQRSMLLEVEEQFSKQVHRDEVKQIKLKQELMDLRAAMSQQVQEQEALEHAKLHQQLQLSGLKRHMANALKDTPSSEAVVEA